MPGTITVTNTLNEVEVTLQKMVVSDISEDHAQRFSFRISVYSGSSLLTSYNQNGFVNGVRTLDGDQGLQDTGTATIIVPPGTKLIVTETGPNLGMYDTRAALVGADDDYNSANYSIADHSYTLQVEAAGGTLVFTNTRAASDLTVRKTVTGDFGNKNYPFPFTLTVPDITASDSYPYIKESTTDGTTWTGVPGEGGTLRIGAMTFTLKDNERVIIRDLPNNKNITLTESNGSYTVRWSFEDSSATVTTGPIKQFQLPQNRTLNVTNTLEAVAPTGFEDVTAPFLRMLAGGLLLALPLILRRKKKA